MLTIKMDKILSKTGSVSPSYPSHLFINRYNSSSLKIPCLNLNSSVHSDFHGFRIFLQPPKKEHKRSATGALSVQMNLRIGKAQRWWEKGIQRNMKEITCAEDLVDSLLKAGDKLVIVDFFSPGCGGCRALHPKICQFAEMNPDVQFLQVNHEEHKSMCYSLNVHVLPFFRLYRGGHGRLSSFSCTNATIKKFKDALAKHSTERCSIGPTRGLEESELVALAANKDLSFNYTPKPKPKPVVQPVAEEAVSSSTSKPIKNYEQKTLITASGR